MRRPKEHFSAYNFRAYPQLYVVRWLKAMGNEPEIVVLEKLDIEALTNSERTAALDEAERRWIAIGRAALGSRLTNRTDGGGGLLGHKHSVSARTKLSEVQKANAKTPEWQVKNAAARKKACSPEAVAKGAATRRAFCQTPEGRAQVALFIAKIHTPEAHQKNSSSQKLLANTPRGLQIRAERSAQKLESLKTPEGQEKFQAFSALSHTPEAVAKMAATKRAQALTPEGRELIENLVRAAHSSEAIAKNSATQRARVRTPEGRAQLLAMQEKAYSPESRAKQSATRKALAQTPEGRAAILKMVEGRVAARQRRLEMSE